MNKKLLSLILMISFFASVVVATLTYGPDNYKKYRHYGLKGSGNDPIYQFMNEVEDILCGTTGFVYTNPLYVVPNSTRPLAGVEVEGAICYDTDDDNLYVYANGGWVDLTAGASGVSDLDTAYNGGSTIDVDTSAVTLTVSDTDNNAALHLIQNDTTNNPVCLYVVNSGSGDSINIGTAGGANDIYGTSGTWYVTGTGTGTFYNLVTTQDITVGDDINMASGDIIWNNTASEIGFAINGLSADLVFDLDAAANTVGLRSDYGTTGLAMGAVDDLSGVGTIAFDAAASTVTLASTGDAQDLTIRVTGANDSSLKFTSAGTGADAISMITSAGGMDFTVAGAAASEDMDFTSNTSINFTTTETAANQFYVQATGAIAGNAVNVATTDGGILLAAAGAANGDVTVTAADDMAITATDDLAINGGSTNSAVTLGTTAFAQLITIGNETGASSLALKAGTGNITMDGVAATTITIGDAAQTGTMKFGESSATVQVDVGTGTGAKTINVGTGGTGAKAITIGDAAAAGAITVQSGTGDLALTSTDAITMTSAGAFNIGANAVAQTIALGNETGASSLALKAGTGNITMDGVAATTITIGDAAQTGTMKFGESSAAVEVDIASGTGNKTVNLGTGTAVNAINIGTGGTGAKTIGIGDGASTGTITVASGSGGALINSSVNNPTGINTGTSTGAVSIGNALAGAITADSAAGISLDAATASNVTCSGADLTLASTTKSVVISGGEAAADAIQLTTVAGGVTVATNGAIANQFYVNAVGAIAGNAVLVDTTNGGISLVADGVANGDITIDSEDDTTLTVGDDLAVNPGGKVTVTTTEAVADQFKVDATGAVAGFATVLETTDGGIQLNADGAANGDISIDSADDMTLTVGGDFAFAVTGALSLGDSAVTNVGDIHVDDIIDDANADIVYSLKTVCKTVSAVTAASADDYQFDNTAVNNTEQVITMTEIIPAYAEVVSVQIRCIEALISSGGDPDVLTSADLGTSSGGAELLATAATDTLNEINAFAAGAAPVAGATNAARSVYFNVVPEDNWSTLTAGRWAILVTYIDYGAVYTQTAP